MEGERQESGEENQRKNLRESQVEGKDQPKRGLVIHVVKEVSLFSH